MFMVPEILLKRKWTLGAKLGAGGFGMVFEATGDDGTKAAVKFIPKEPGAQRELLFEELTGIPGVVPIVDSGEHDDNWVIVMPRAEKSLLAHLNAHSGHLPEEESVAILKAVANALVALVDRKVVHRDIKPANILLLEGNWCLSDFGIARYAEASTAPDTRKLACTPAYSAPERWRDERATSQSDVYSVGIMAFELLEGHRPFPGPLRSDFREQHLYTPPPRLMSCSDRLAVLVTECLYKPPETRPLAANLHARLGRISRPRSAGSSALRAVNRAVVESQSADAAKASAARSEVARREQIAAVAGDKLEDIFKQLHDAVVEDASACKFFPVRQGLIQGGTLKLLKASMKFHKVEQNKIVAWKGINLPFRVLAHSEIEIDIPEDRYQYSGRSHALWYCDAVKADEYHWYETAFMISAMLPAQGKKNPFALSPNAESAQALSMMMGNITVAWPFIALELDAVDDFISRWQEWFAKAVQGQLEQPKYMPERDAKGSWRR